MSRCIILGKTCSYRMLSRAFVVLPSSVRSFRVSKRLPTARSLGVVTAQLLKRTLPAAAPVWVVPSVLTEYTSACPGRTPHTPAVTNALDDPTPKGYASLRVNQKPVSSLAKGVC